ncbi:Cardiolipin synthase [Planctomycetales bacterium 10988]|nr:Cardiolipin synthase [Planctomycetales bacterium 10988]
MFDEFLTVWFTLVTVVSFCLSVSASCHVILTKRDTATTLGWVGIIWLVPVVGLILYLLFGINRIKRRASLLRANQPNVEIPVAKAIATSDRLLDTVGDDCTHLNSLAQLTGDLTERPLLFGNSVTPLFNGDQAYPEMLKAIDEAKKSITLGVYIFDNDPSGRAFLAALRRAKDRGVEIRVLIDDIGSRYTWPPIPGLLREAGITVETFLPPRVWWRFPFSNLRNHRKILVVDGYLGFTGGLNIRIGNYLQTDWQNLPDGGVPAYLNEKKAKSLIPRKINYHPIRDIHFKLEGPVVTQMQEVFAQDWAFSTGERLIGEPWFLSHEADGPSLARGIADGPDEDFEKLRMTILGGLACAQKSILICTPYFLPDTTLATALNIAALRGVEVDVILPSENNISVVGWATMSKLWELLEHGCRIWFQPPPFDHTKLMIVDEAWTLFGSGNWDPRSLRLNFEFNVECYDEKLATQLAAHLQDKISRCHLVTLPEVEARPLRLKLRDGIAGLFSPYL